MRTVYYTKHRRKRAAKKRLAILILFIISFTLVVILTRSLRNHTPATNQGVESTSIEPETLSEDKEPSHSPPLKQATSQLLGNAVQGALTGTHGDYGILVKNLKTKEFYSTNEHMKFYSASLYKLWVMLTVFEQINNKTLSKGTIMSQDVKILNKKFNIASESAEQEEGTIKMTVGEALEKMITISDNYAALLLTEKVKLNTIDSILKKNGFFESHLGTNGNPPTTTPYDIGLFFEKLYNGQLSNQQSTDEMIRLLKAQRLNDKIPKYLPFNVIVAHKTGELDEYTHDAGIIYTPEYDYILVILSKSDAPDLAKTRVANISQKVYSYFNHN